MIESKNADTRAPDFVEVTSIDAPPEENLRIEDLRNVCLTVTGDLGTATLTVREVLELKEGSVLPLTKLAGEMIDIYVNGVPLARGEVVVIGDHLHIRVGDILGATEDGKEMAGDET